MNIETWVIVAYLWSGGSAPIMPAQLGFSGNSYPSKEICEDARSAMRYDHAALVCERNVSPAS